MDELELENYKIKWGEAVTSSDFWDKMAQEGVWPQQQFNLSDELLAKYYEAATEFLEEKNWSEARDAFLFLAFLNPTYQNFWLGLGISEQTQAEFPSALAAYVMAEALDPENPVVHANAFQCHVAVGNHDLAERSYQRALEICGDKPEYAEVKSKVVQQKQRLDQSKKK